MKSIADAFVCLEKGQAAAIFQLCSEDSPLDHYLAKVKAVDGDRFLHFNRKITKIYILTYCPEYTRRRRKMRNAIREADIKIDTRRSKKPLDPPKTFPYLAKFIISRNRVENLTRFIET